MVVSLGSASFTLFQDSSGKYICDDSVFINAFGLGDKNLVVYDDSDTGNTSVRANFNIKDNTSSSGIDYTRGFLRGVEKNWSCATVSTYAEQNANGFEVTINNVATVNDYCHADFDGPITMYTGDGRSGLNHLYSYDDFMSTAAHEFRKRERETPRASAVG